MKYTYNVNLNERGSFYADVRDENENTVFEIKAGNELGEDESSIFEDGFMRHQDDVSGLTEYLRDIGVISQTSEIVQA